MTENLFFATLVCLSLLLVSCDSQKNSVTNSPVSNEGKSTAKTSSDAGPGKITPQTLPAQDQTGKLSEQASKNTVPVITKAQLKSEVINSVDSLKVYAEGGGGEGSEVTFKYEWTKNGEPAGDTNTVTGFKRGDKIAVRVTPYDGKVYGQAKTVTTEIGNLPPKIIEHKDLLSAGKVFSYQVKATDPDGDTLTYSLRSAPQGMTIDSATGLIKWEIPGDFEGKAPVTVSVTDGHGGETFQSFTVDTRIEKSRLKIPTP